MTACKDNDLTRISSQGFEFTVTVENVFTDHDFKNSGAFGGITPGSSVSFQFNAGVDAYLSFATMFTASNDMFFAPLENGIKLYENREPITGDITSEVLFWDAGTEVNEEPGSGANQPGRQTGPDMGMDQNGNVELLDDAEAAGDDTFGLFGTESQFIRVMAEHDGGTLFTITIVNEHTSDVTIDGNTISPVNLSSGVWVIHSVDQAPLFVDGQPSSEGLEDIAEDGSNAVLDSDLQANSGFVSNFSRGAYSVGTENTLFTMGSPASDALEVLAEDGDPSGFTNVFDIPVGSTTPSAISPGQSYEFTFNALEGDNLSLATMLIESNDYLIGLNSIPLFNTDGSPINGDLTQSLNLYDAGTEIDEFSGAGNNQPGRQTGPNTGPDENGVVVLETNPNGTQNNIPAYLSVSISSSGGSGATLGVRLVTIDPINDEVTIQNFGTDPIDISGYRMCSRFSYSSNLTELGSAQLDFMLEENETVTFSWNMNDNSSDVGLYLPSSGTAAFSDATQMVDFMQYNGSNGRESEANLAGIWEPGTSVSGQGPFNYIGNGAQDGVQFWQ
ncbi:MAG: spondin domain-containing protein [Bacteroidota bacterium]